MVGQYRFVQTLSASCILLLAMGRIAIAEDALSPAPQLEPVDFIDNARPQQADPTNRRRGPNGPTGWGYAVFSPDSKFVAIVSVADGKESGEVMVWDVADPKKSVRFEQAARIGVVAFSPDGKWLAIGLRLHLNRASR